VNICHIYRPAPFYCRSVINLCVRLCLINKSLSLQTVSGVHPPSYWMGTSDFFAGSEAAGVHLHLVPRFALSGTILPLPPHGLVYIGTALALSLSLLTIQNSAVKVLFWDYWPSTMCCIQINMPLSSRVLTMYIRGTRTLERSGWTQRTEIKYSSRY
jgi:hypothetical protein